MSESSIAPLIISSLALAVSGTAALSTFVFNTKKSARELWQKQLEIYIANPAHLLGRPTKGTEESKQAYRAHVGYIFLALEELLKAFPRDPSWRNLVRRHLQRHAEYVREVLADDDRRLTYSGSLQKQMRDAVNANS